MKLRSKKPRLVAAQSFTPAEVACLRSILNIVLRGGDPDVVRRVPAFARLCAKTQKMQARIDSQRTKRAQIEVEDV